MALDEVLNDGETEPRPALLARAGLVNAIKALENTFDGLRRYPRAIILDEDFHLPPLSGASPNGDGALGAPVFDGVIHKVAQDLLQAVAVCADGQVRGAVEQGCAFSSRTAFEILQDLGHDREESHRLQVEFNTPGLEF